MAETKNQEEPTFTTKRKSDLHPLDNEDFPKKSIKIQNLDSNHFIADNEDLKRQEIEDVSKADNASQVASDNSSALSDVKSTKQDASFMDSEVNDIQDHRNGNDGDKEDKELNGGSEVDRNGKAIMLGDKGKGKMIVENEEDEDEDDSDDDDSDSDSDSNDDWEVSNDGSDLSDDPLAEVDLENILPSRTRRRTFHLGIYNSNDIANDADEEDDDSDDNEE